MHLKSYINLKALLANKVSSREENRAFGLANIMVKNKVLEQLNLWTDTYKHTLAKPRLSETFTSYLYDITLTLVIGFFVLGFVSGIGLLSYSGHEPVNVVYFIAIVGFIPLLTMLLTVIAMLRAGNMHNVLIHLSPAFWMEKVVRFLPHTIQEKITAVKMNPLVSNWIVIKRSQLIALFFSIGLLLALMAVVITKDIAFSWSTTLHITPEAFHSFLYTSSLPWREFFPSAVPSLELVEQSQYFRLGRNLDAEMIKHASTLGEWWKYLALTTLFYAIFLRFLMYLLAAFGLNKAIEKASLTLSGARKLLSEMNEPIISTHSKKEETPFLEKGNTYNQTIQHLDASYDVVQGWAMSEEELLVLGDSMSVITPHHFEVGGTNTLPEDSEVISKSHGEVLLFVKAWEPPTMDFIDYLKALSMKVDKVIIVPVGTVQKQYEITKKELAMWARKLMVENDRKVWLKISTMKALGKEVENAK